MNQELLDNIAGFAVNEYVSLRDKYAETFVDQGNVTSSSMLFSLLIAHYMIDILSNSPELEINYYGALLELISVQTKRLIDANQIESKSDVVDWEAGKQLLTNQ